MWHPFTKRKKIEEKAYYDPEEITYDDIETAQEAMYAESPEPETPTIVTRARIARRGMEMMPREPVARPPPGKVVKRGLAEEARRTGHAFLNEGRATAKAGRKAGRFALDEGKKVRYAGKNYLERIDNESDRLLKEVEEKYKPRPEEYSEVEIEQPTMEKYYGRSKKRKTKKKTTKKKTGKQKHRRRYEGDSTLADIYMTNELRRNQGERTLEGQGIDIVRRRTKKKTTKKKKGKQKNKRSPEPYRYVSREPKEDEKDIKYLRKKSKCKTKKKKTSRSKKKNNKRKKVKKK